MLRGRLPRALFVFRVFYVRKGSNVETIAAIIVTIAVIVVTNAAIVVTIAAIFVRIGANLTRLAAICPNKLRNFTDLSF